MIRYKILKVIKIIILVSIAFLLITSAVQWLWNSLIPDLFAGPHLNFAQTSGLLILSRVFFGHWGKRRGGCGYSRRHYWRMKFKEKMANLSPEERERYQAFFRHRKCRGAWDEADLDNDSEENQEEKYTKF